MCRVCTHSADRWHRCMIQEKTEMTQLNLMDAVGRYFFPNHKELIYREDMSISRCSRSCIQAGRWCTNSVSVVEIPMKWQLDWDVWTTPVMITIIVLLFSIINCLYFLFLHNSKFWKITTFHHWNFIGTKWPSCAGEPLKKNSSSSHTQLWYFLSTMKRMDNSLSWYITYIYWWISLFT